MNSFEESSLEDIRKAGKQLVAKRNDLIQQARYSFDLLQNKVLLYMISKVRPGDTQEKLYEFRFSELFAVLRYKTDSYTEVKRIIQSMNSLSFWSDAENEEDDDVLITIFDSDSVSANQKKGYFKAQFSKRIFPYIMELQKQKDENGIYYTSYQLQNVILMKHFYSQRLYEILKSYQYNNLRWTFELGTGSSHDLQKRLAGVDGETKKPVIPKGWSNYHIFKRDVLKPAQRDINRYTDIKIEYEPSKIDFYGKKHRRYVRITFAMVSKTPGEIEETDKYIDSVYREIDDDNRYHQTTLDEFIEKHNEKRSKEIEDVTKHQDDKIHSEGEEYNTDKSDEDDFERRIEKSAFPIFTSCYGKDFTEEQLKYLYEYACQHITPGTIMWSDRDLWVTDYITHYKNKIDATAESTKTTPYRRLLDMIEKDYDHIAPAITETHSIKRLNPAMKGENKSSEDDFTMKMNKYVNMFTDDKE